MITDWEYQGEYLNQFNPNYRGAVGNIFCTGARYHGKSIASIFHYIKSYIRDMHWAEGESEQAEAYRQLVESLDSDGAREFAAFICERDQLPAEEKQRLKEIKKERDAKAYMATQAPTERQISYLRSLGHRGFITSKLEASELIGEYLKQKA